MSLCRRSTAVSFAVVLATISCGPVYINGKQICALFSMPDLPAEDSAISVQENSTLTVHFELVKVKCPENPFQEFIIILATNFGAIKCEIMHKRGICVTHRESLCQCGNGTNKYIMSKMASRKDMGVWTFYTSGNEAMTGEKQIFVNVLYPAEITDLFLTSQTSDPSHFIDLGTPAEAICFWKNGNPPVQARLFDRRENEFVGSITGNGHIRYRFAGVGCQDAGLIRCQAPGASHNKTARLLLKCPPLLLSHLPKTVQLLAGASTDLLIYIQSYMRDMGHKLCRLLRDAWTSECQRFSLSLTGSPPDLLLTVRLDNVRKEEEGQWRLELSTEAGFKHLFFSLIVDERDNETDFRVGSTETPDARIKYNTSSTDSYDWTTSDIPDGNNTTHELSAWRVGVIVFVVAAVIGGVVAGVAVTVCIMKRGEKRRGKATFEMEGMRQAKIISRVNFEALPLPKQSTAVSHHFYHEANTETVKIETDPVLPTPKPRTKALKKLADQDYLEPVPSVSRFPEESQ